MLRYNETILLGLKLLPESELSNRDAALTPPQ